MPFESTKELPAAPAVFISYAWADGFCALTIDQWLRNHGARVLIDRRDFIAGNDIEAEIVRCVKQTGKVICIYSKNSANRPYPELERRIASALEKLDAEETGSCRRLIYFCIDHTPLPTEALPRLAIKATEMGFSKACEELWRSILGKSAAPTELDLSKFDDKPPWKMDEVEQQDVVQAAWDAMHRIYEGQTSGSTLDKWKRETFEELIENIDILPEDQRFQRILARLAKMVKKDEQWEDRNTSDSKAESQNGFFEAKDVNADNLAAMAARALSSAMFHGVMADNRSLHRIRHELLEDILRLETERASHNQVIQHMKKVLLS
jgi:hypothetical protein